MDLFKKRRGRSRFRFIFFLNKGMIATVVGEEFRCMVLEKIYLVTKGIQSKAVSTCECSRVPGCACNLPLRREASRGRSKGRHVFVMRVCDGVCNASLCACTHIHTFTANCTAVCVCLCVCICVWEDVLRYRECFMSSVSTRSRI